MSRFPTVARVLGPAACLALALTACSGGPSAPAGGPASSASSAGTPSASPSAPVVAPTEGGTVTGQALSAQLAQALAGAPSATLSLVLTQGVGKAPMSGEGRTAWATGGSSTTLDIATGDPDTGTVTVLGGPGGAYLKVEKGAELPPGEQWVKISDLSASGGLFTGLFGGLAGNLLAFSSPDGILRAVAAAPELTVKSVDPDGTATYSTVLAPDQVAELYDLGLFGGDKAARAGVAKAGTDDGQYQLTLGVDGAGRPVAVQLQGTSGGEPVGATTTYTGWSPAAEPIDEPAAGVTVDSAEMDKALTS